MTSDNYASEIEEEKADLRPDRQTQRTTPYALDDRDRGSSLAASSASLSRCCTHDREHELRPYVSPRNGDRHVHMETLGEGPVAPRAAAETVVAAEKGIEDVSPGMKGWVCLLGVSRCYQKLFRFNLMARHS